MPAILREFGPDIWIADGPIVTAAGGFHYPTRMVVIRLVDGNLFLWSPTRMSDELRADIDTLGSVRYLIPPNSLHHVFLGDWQRTYPNAKAYAPPGLIQKRGDIRFDGNLDETAQEDWAGEIDLVVMRGNLITTEVVFFHQMSKTVLFTDLIQHFKPNWFRGWRALIAKLDLMVGPEPSVPRKFRVGFTNRRAARTSVERILDWPSEKVLMAHGDPITENGQAFMARAFRWLTRG
ncbi:DUF4336 domain-containing protein [Rhizobium sp. P40RR-XXII]|uniref:DUF4336 domain-containing protein n=1 Tax=unclassified Rhizobium TaxID=2613769 RepID=UPI001456E3AE|nr:MULTISPECIES: DUF4336 domain-containing protein [unclassified Rhizobium]NLR83786.1 DUF4336 domain-containing protein [Rhizobium sp. P28RR-XV]NLS15569.1 DUF4336 domain-containing protein [Rhizobium sp. P40RR-XXII]